LAGFADYNAADKVSCICDKNDLIISQTLRSYSGKDASKRPIGERIGETAKCAKAREINMLFLFVISVILLFLKELGLGRIEHIQYAMKIIMLEAVMILVQFMV
jgi:hypothetical protein